MNLKSWALGLMNAFVSGIASAVTVSWVDPRDFNFSHDGLKHLGALALGSGVVSLAKYILQYHIPGIPPQSSGQ